MGDLRDFLLPDLGEGLESGEIVAWHVEVGDHVELNQAICDVETAKAVVSVPCPFAGTVMGRFGEVGDELDVGQPLIRVDVEAVAAAPEPVPEHAQEVTRAGPAGEHAEEVAPAEPAAQAADTSVLVGYGAADRGTRRRRRRRERTGDGQQAGAGARGAASPAAAPADAAAGREAIGFRGRRPGESIPLAGIRKRIAARMSESRRRIPHATCSVTVDCTELWRLPERLTEVATAEGDRVRISAFVLVLRAAVLGLRRFPMLNAVLDEEAGEIRLLEAIHLGVAADTPRGLLVPVIRNAHTLTTLQLASELDRLVAAARDGSIGRTELTGGTFTLTNYGTFSNDEGDPIINYPEAAILGVGAMKERPWVVGGQLAVRRTAKLTCAFDHRICDGGEAGRFVAYVGGLVEEPVRMLLHV